MKLEEEKIQKWFSQGFDKVCKDRFSVSAKCSC